MSGHGHTTWIIPGGRIPEAGTGREPEFTSRDELWLLNTGGSPADLSATLYYEDQEPVGRYNVRIDAQRVRHIRINDLIDPEAIMLDRAYALVIDATVPVVVQVARYDTRQASQTMSWSMAFPVVS